jgi:hypothetical protein
MKKAYSYRPNPSSQKNKNRKNVQMIERVFTLTWTIKNEQNLHSSDETADHICRAV